ncbi:hypothetical protein D3C78_1525830 [compost metagenome]
MNKYLALVHAEAILDNILPAINAAIITTMLAAVLLMRTDTIKARIATMIPTNQIKPVCMNKYFHWGTL